ncbi:MULTISPECIES: DUF4105 domain-containing protein [unclassified Pseudomonas]|uniref:DUF4105 domain-containing protein n=1 Tax=unclassified Pseudomonas TaxID=196821 RepID=UPI0021C6DBF6|nr:MULTISPECIES: DUF4105 domain-containing protein [unclassified Pseudomonas]MCU1732263.1 DUF4105 domain-containing protein [Pseudomonas sp. 20P_3.2_Bac4]MCU1745222.1 DUF4105 domain-containing protein [Pseudomonas sp. 20P_3.2_Bac5]
MRPLLVLLAVLALSGCALKPQAVDPDFAAVSAVATGAAAPSSADYQHQLQSYQHDPAYACRQPLYAAWFLRQSVAAAAPAPCAASVPFAVQTPDEGVQVVWIDPARVSAVHLLFAGNSPSPASRFGHVALRLVVCPAADSSPASCDSNLAEHLVLSFQAHVDDFTLDVLKALGGEYQARLFASRFMDSYEQYAIGEFRELYSLPLRLDAGQRQALVRDMAQIHWQFSGSYDFFTRNCATLLQQALRATWREYAENPDMAERFLRPDTLFAALRDSPLAEGAALASLEQAEHDGFYFSSTRPFYDEALSRVRQHMPGEGFSSLRDYLEIAPQVRRHALEDPAYAERLTAESRTLDAQLMLEEYALFSSQRLLLGQAAQYLRRQDFSARATVLDPAHGEIFEACFLRPLRQRIGPPRRTSGIPDSADRFSDLPAFAAQCRSEQARRLLTEAMLTVADDGSEQWQQLNRLTRYRADTLDNIVFLRQLRP